MPLRLSIRGPRRDDSTTGAVPRPQPVEVACDGSDVVFGRAAGSTVELPFPKVSARHARLFRTADGYCIEDLGSSNGTRLGGRSLTPHVPEVVAVGQVVELGGVEVTLVADGAGQVAASDDVATGTLARRLVHDVFEACPPAEQARLVVLSGPAQGRELAIGHAGRVFKLGRGETCDWAIPDEDVSREHAAFARTARGITVCDVGSKNGVEVSGRMVVGEHVLRDGDVLRVGETRLRLVDPEDRYLRQVEAAERELARNSAELGSTAAPASPVPGGAADEKGQPVTVAGPSRLPLIASLIAGTVLLLALGLVLALALTL